MEKMSMRARFCPLKKLASLWLNDFLTNEATYRKTIIPMVVSGNFSNFTSEEIEILNEIKKNLSKNEWKNLSALFSSAVYALKKETYNNEILTKGRICLSNNDFQGFENLKNESPSNKNILKNLENAYDKALEAYVNTLKENIIKLSYKNFKKACTFFYKEAKNLPEPEKVNIGLFLENLEDLANALSSYDFLAADKLFYTKKAISNDEYETLKKHYVLQYFKNENIDEEKSLAIASIRPNVLLRARAGSGKTSTICLKTLFLIEKYNINPDHILILAFNKEAAVKIKKDLFEKYGLKNYLPEDGAYQGAAPCFENAKTFHSFAKSISDNKKIIEEKARVALINEAIDTVLSENEYKKEFYNFYKTSLEIPIKSEIQVSNEENVTFIKDLSQITLKGDIVKSFGEKYIADFLFEHGVEYEYEKSIIFTKEEKEALNIDDKWNVYHPDFYITQGDKEFYLEHWGVDEKMLEPNYFGGKGVISDVSKYIKNMHIKRRYFRKKNIPLIETWAKHSQIRANFEIILANTLKEFGIKAEKLDEEILFNKVKTLNSQGFYRTVEKFISTVKKSKFDNFYIIRKFDDPALSDRTKIFLKLGYRVYLEYQRVLKEKNLADFDDLIIDATEKIMKTRGEAEFKIHSGAKLKVKDIKYVLIDEYQDFSKLFFDLILAIKCFNPKLKIFATGDDWQAINGFAGSNLYYFNNFEKLFINSKSYNLTSNYRSFKKIIDVSNTLMAPNGVPSVPVKQTPGEVSKIDVDKTFINKDSTGDLIYAFKKDFGKLKARYLKTVHRLIRLHPGKNFLILSRLNKISGSGLDFEFGRKLLKMKTVDKNSVKVMTIHKSKGLEADIVIILRTINGVIPFLHPDYEIMKALDKNYDEILAEEKRLFYVALTRAREKVYILTESGLESVYLKKLNLNTINFRNLNFEDEA